MDNFPNIEVSEGTNPMTKVRILTAQFGDGYEQVQADGINNVYEDWDVVWTNLSISDSATVIDFLKSHKGVDAFSWVSPKGETYSYRCKQWSEVFRTNKRRNIRAVFERDF